jgi:cytochrome c peroxidase
MFNSLEMGNLRCSTKVEESGEKDVCTPIRLEDLTEPEKEAIRQGTMKVRDKVELVVDGLKANSEYKDLFKKAFDHDIESADSKETFGLTLQAIASFERTLTSTDSLFDRWVKEEAPISWDAQKGWKLFFGKARCSLCHIPPTYSDGDFHNLGVPRAIKQGKEVEDKGRASFLDQHPQSQDPGEYLNPLRPLEYEVRKGGGHYWEEFGMDACAYKTPSLRNVEHTQPYMHTGAFDSLEKVVKFYVDGGGDPPPRCSKKDWRIQKLDLDETEQGYIVEFLKTLSGTKVPAGVPAPTLK